MVSVVRIGVVDDHPLMLEGIAQTVKSMGGFDIAGLGSTMNESLIIADSQRPDIMILDVSIPGGGIEAARKITENHSDIKLVMLTVSERYDHVKEALKIGVRGYILKGASGPDLRDCLQAVVAGKRYVTTELLMGMLMAHEKKVHHTEASAHLRPTNSFTAREKAVADLLIAGNSNKKIGVVLGISEKTVKHYMTLIMHKLNVENRLEAVLILTQTKNSAQDLLDDIVRPATYLLATRQLVVNSTG
jgi:two-component system, NarL family, nitrate/nitrite response regulator NarL